MTTNIKKVSAIILTLAFALTAAACGGQQGSSGNNSGGAAGKPSEANSANTAEKPGSTAPDTPANAPEGAKTQEAAAAQEGEKAEAPEGAKSVSPSQAKAGDVVVFGAYEQDRDFANGLEPIEWQVLDKDGDTLLLVSRRVLDGQPYDISDGDVSWESCTLRTWLNRDFYETAFLPEEQEAILVSDVTADPNPQESTDPGNNTQDKVFLLSISETEKYFPSEKDRTCEPTAYAKAMGVLYMQFDEFSTWWLRTPGNGKSYAAFYEFESFNYAGKLVDHDDYGVRPALRVNSSALETALKTAGIDVSKRRIPAEAEERSIDLESLKSAGVGSTVLFGTYEQDGDPQNGAEPIEWTVLDRDGSRLLLLSRCSLDNHPFRGASRGSKWSSCTLRGWMNNDFFRRAFTREEQDLIQTTHVTADTNPQHEDVDPGEDTDDQVFLLSVTEAEKYLPDDAARTCQTTDYAGAKAKRAGVITETNALAWWLRTPGMNANNIAFIRGRNGDLKYDGTQPGDHNGVVRPAIWIDPGN